VGNSSQDSSARVASTAGFVIAALFLLSALSAPARDLLAPGLASEQLAALYRENRTAVLGGVYVGSLTWGGVFLVFAGALAAYLFVLGSEAGALIGLAGAVLEAAVILLFCALSNAAAFAAGGGEPSTVLALHQGALLANNISGFPTIVCVGAFTLSGQRLAVFPAWVVALAVACILLHAVSSASLAASGFFAPSGPASMMAPLTMVLWVLGVSIVLRRGIRTAA
jgi:hypothetical protein